MPVLTAGGPGAGPLPRLRPAQQRAHPALRGRVGPPLPRRGPEHDRRPGAALPVRRRPARRSPPASSASASSSRSRSTPTATLWHAYGCEGWPSLFLWSLGGALSWFHFGEGEYLGTEEAIQAELREQDALRQDLPAPIEPLRADRRPRRPGDGAQRRALPGRLLGAPLDRRRGRRGARRPLRGGRRPRDARGRRRARGRARRRAGSSRCAVDGAGPLRPRRAPAARAPTSCVLRPSPGLRVWSVSFAAGVP